MNKVRSVAVSLLLAVGFLCLTGGAFGEGPLDTAKDILYPELDFKYVQFLPNGHLGQNKPRYRKFDWKVYESRRFKIYTYGVSDDIVNWYLEEAEKTYDEYSKETGMNSFSDKIRVIIYNSVRDFEETNLVGGLIPDGLGGVTEMLRWKRVVIAFRNSPVGFKHVLRHELYHRYQTELIQFSLSNILTRGWHVPLWFIEGSPEHFAHPWAAAGELIVRDAYLNNHLGSVTEMHWGYSRLVYQEGHFVLDFLTEKFKDKGNVVGAILVQARKLQFPEAFEAATGQSLKDFDKDFIRYVEERYHNLRAKTDITDKAATLAEHSQVLASKDQFFVTKKEDLGRIALFINWTDGKEIYSKKLVESGHLSAEAIRGLDYEVQPGFGFQENGASFASGNRVVYAVDIGGRDEIRIQEFSFDQKERKFKLGKAESYIPKNLRDIQHPILVNEEEIVFIGRNDTFAEIFLFNRKTGQLKQLTSLKRNCGELTYSPLLNAVVTSMENNATHSYDLAYVELQNGAVHWLTQTPENEWYPEFSPDGSRLLYVSDRGLVHNIYLYDFSTKLVTPLTDVKIGVFRPKWFTENGMLFNNFANQATNVQLMPLPDRSGTGFSEASRANAATVFTDSEKPFLELLPNADTLTITDTVIAPEKDKALVVVNRKLSLDTLKRGDSPIGFYLIDLAKKSVINFNLPEFDDFEAFGKPEFLTGNKILFKKFSGLKNQTKAYVYDWAAKELEPIEDSGWGIKLSVLDIGKAKNSFLKVSPDRDRLVLVNEGKLKLYDVKQNKIILNRAYQDVVDLFFTSNNTLLVAAWESNGLLNALLGGELKFYHLDIDQDTTLRIDWFEKENFVAWYLLPDKKDVFVVSNTKKTFWETLASDKPEYYSIRLLNIETKSLTLLQTDLLIFKGGKLEGEKLVIETQNLFGLKRTLTITRQGAIKFKDDPLPNVVQQTAVDFNLNNSIEPQTFKVSRSIPRKPVGKPSAWPKPYAGFGGGGYSQGQASVALGLILLDDLNDQELVTYLNLQNKHGFVNLDYVNFPSGRSLSLNYWSFDDFHQKFDVGVSQNIFLDQFLNWDINLKEQYVKVKPLPFSNNYGHQASFTREWWQTKLGTTFSLDTTVNDLHGPVSGSAVFSGVESGVNNQFQYQNFDLNFDARHFIPFTERCGLAFRLAGGESFGFNPTTFVWGGNETFRGIPLFSQSGNIYALQSSELRFPVFDLVAAKVSGPADDYVALLIRYFDVRGGIYNDIGDIWYNRKPVFVDGHQNFQLEYSAGYFIDAPFMLGMLGFDLRFNQGLYGKKDWNFWLGVHW